jgi:hypothetical protein
MAGRATAIALVHGYALAFRFAVQPARCHCSAVCNPMQIDEAYHLYLNKRFLSMDATR